MKRKSLCRELNLFNFLFDLTENFNGLILSYAKYDVHRKFLQNSVMLTHSQR